MRQFLMILIQCNYNNYKYCREIIIIDLSDLRVISLRESGLYGKWSHDILQYKHSNLDKSVDNSLYIHQGKASESLFAFKPIYVQNIYGLDLLYSFGAIISIIFILLELLFKFCTCV